MEYEVVEDDSGTAMLVREDGIAIGVRVIDLIAELHKQNPRFAAHWLQLAEDYVGLGIHVGEA